MLFDLVGKEKEWRDWSGWHFGSWSPRWGVKLLLNRARLSRSKQGQKNLLQDIATGFMYCYNFFWNATGSWIREFWGGKWWDEVLEGCMKVVWSVGKVISTLSQAQHFKKVRFGLIWLLTWPKNKDLEQGLECIKRRWKRPQWSWWKGSLRADPTTLQQHMHVFLFSFANSLQVKVENMSWLSKNYQTNAKHLIYEMSYLLSYSHHEKKNNKFKYFEEIINNYLTNAKNWSMQWAGNHTMFLGCDSGVL